MYNYLQLREIFHLQFLRWFGKKMNPSFYALKGGVNLRFFYNSIRYSEDIDLDVKTVSVSSLKDKVMKILDSRSFQESFYPFGINEIVPPNISKAKQTKTTQRFKVHLITSSEEDLFTKIEFSRRNFDNNIKVEGVSNNVLRKYKLAPLLVPHHGLDSAILQKINALAKRTSVQARDLFDLYFLSSQKDTNEKIELNKKLFKKAKESILEISFEQFKSTVVVYLSKQDQETYNSESVLDEIKLKTINFIEQLL